MKHSISIRPHGKATQHGPKALGYIETVTVARGLYQSHTLADVCVWRHEEGEPAYVVWSNGIFLPKKEVVKS